MRKLYIRIIMSLVLGGLGIYLVWSNTNGWVVLGVFLMLFGNNIDRVSIW